MITMRTCQVFVLVYMKEKTSAAHVVEVRSILETSRGVWDAAIILYIASLHKREHSPDLSLAFHAFLCVIIYIASGKYRLG